MKRMFLCGLYIVFSTFIYSSDAGAAPKKDLSRSTNRLAFSVGGGHYASYPNSIGDNGPLLGLTKPFWYGHRYKYFQWVFGGTILGGYGTDYKHGYLTIAPHFGFQLYFGKVFGFEFLYGVGAGLQVGTRTVPSIGLHGQGSWVFRIFRDPRQRLKIAMYMNMFAYLAADPGNDFGTNAMAMGMALSYETPF